MARMTLEHWDPWTDLARAQRELGGLLTNASRAVRAWAPPLDVLEADDQVLVRIDLPGVKPEDMQVEVHDNVLRVAAQRESSPRGEDSGRTFVERRHGSFERQLVLPEGVDHERIEATCEHGVLEIRIPKPVKALPRTIEVRRGAAAGEPPVEVEAGDGEPGGADA